MRGSARGYATIALTRCPLEPGPGSFETPIIPGQRAPFHIDTPESGLNDRWIEAKKWDELAEIFAEDSSVTSRRGTFQGRAGITPELLRSPALPNARLPQQWRAGTAGDRE